MPIVSVIAFYVHQLREITDSKRELEQPNQLTDLRAPEEQVGCEGGASRLFTLYHLRKVCKYSYTAECPILLWKYV